MEKALLLRRCVLRISCGMWLLSLLYRAGAQELEPRAYSVSPIGTSFVGMAFGRSSGDVTFDPTIPITNVKATLYFPGMGLGQTFPLFRRQALITAVIPYAWGTVSGDVHEQQGSISRSGMPDIKTRLSINLRGSPALTPREFARRKPRGLVIGTSLTMTAPSGQYSNEKLINLGTNRWSFKPEVGISVPVKRFDLDAYAGVWLFTENASFYPNYSSRTQAPLVAVQSHVSYTVRRGLWAALDYTWYGGGAVTVNGGTPTERQSNSRAGATLSLPVHKGHSMKIAYSSGVSGNIGSKFNTVSVGWQYVWFDRR